MDVGCDVNDEDDMDAKKDDDLGTGSTKVMVYLFLQICRFEYE